MGATLFQPVKRHMKPADVPNEKKTLLDPIPTPETSDNEEEEDVSSAKNNCKNHINHIESGKNCNGLKITNCEKDQAEDVSCRDDASLISGN